MIKRFNILILLCTLATLSLCAQEKFTGKYYSEELKTTLQLNLQEACIPLHDLEFDETYGFMRGGLNGTWVVLKVKKADDRQAVVRMVSDIGIDAQDVELRLSSDGTILELRLLKEANIKRVENKKYVKMPKVVTFKRR